jgi:hypothetical protein
MLLRFFRTVCLLHDIDALRSVPSGATSEKVTAHANCLITTGRLADYVPAAKKSRKVVRLELWDYLLAPSFRGLECRRDGRIVFVGNLSPEKSPGIFRPGSNRPPLLLVGTLYNPLANPFEQDEYIGPCKADHPEIHVAVSWGLVWEGGRDKHNALTGNEYERINQPHKLSFYLACGIPVIMWEGSFASEFVIRRNCGITVSSLDNIEEKISRISHDDYNVKAKNARAVGACLRQGVFLRAALKQVTGLRVALQFRSISASRPRKPL